MVKNIYSYEYELTTLCVWYCKYQYQQSLVLYEYLV